MSVIELGRDLSQNTDQAEAELKTVWHVCDSEQHRLCSKDIGDLALVHTVEPIDINESLDTGSAFIMKLQVNDHMLSSIDDNGGTARVWLPKATSRPFSVTKYIEE